MQTPKPPPNVGATATKVSRNVSCVFLQTYNNYLDSRVSLRGIRESMHLQLI